MALGQIGTALTGGKILSKLLPISHLQSSANKTNKTLRLRGLGRKRSTVCLKHPPVSDTVGGQEILVVCMVLTALVMM